MLAVERNPLIYVVLADGLRRAAANPNSTNTCANLTLVHLDAKTYLNDQAADDFDVIYLDPMYPHRRKSALVKQEMRVLREYTGDDEDAAALLSNSLASGVKRVVVKRPLHAPVLGNKKPSLQYRGKSTRFDVYVN